MGGRGDGLERLVLSYCFVISFTIGLAISRKTERKLKICIVAVINGTEPFPRTGPDGPGGDLLQKLCLLAYTDDCKSAFTYRHYSLRIIQTNRFPNIFSLILLYQMAMFTIFVITVLS